MSGLIPLDVSKQLLRYARREAMWRGAVFGFAAGVVLTFLLLFTGAAGAIEIPREAKIHQRELMRAARHVWGLNAPTATFAAQVHQESRWRSDAVSWAGAQGLTQFMPRTADWMQDVFASELGHKDPFDPRWALRAQARYMRFLWERVQGADDCQRMAFALAAYNGGLGWVNRRKARSDEPLVCLGATCEINPGIYPANQKENAGYSRRILLVLEPIYVEALWGSGSCST